MLFVIYMFVSSLCLYPRTCHIPKTPKVDQGEGESRIKWKAICEKSSETTTIIIAGKDLLESNGDVIRLKAFVCLFLITVATPQDGLKG